MSRSKGFPPIENHDAVVLILGSMPGKASLAAGEYYAHPRNLFWPIMGELVGAYPALSYEERVCRLKSAGIALWDVLSSCVRSGSLDSHIEEASIVTNDFQRFFARHRRVDYVFFNGSKAEQCFRRHVKLSPEARMIKYKRLPSTSPANVGTSREEKLGVWMEVARKLNKIGG